VSDDSRQKCVGCRACWNVRSKQIRFVLFALHCIHALVQARRVFRTPCTSTVDCHWRCGHFLRYSGYRNFDTRRQSVSQSCSNYTANHFNLTTTECITSHPPASCPAQLCSLCKKEHLSWPAYLRGSCDCNGDSAFIRRPLRWMEITLWAQASAGCVWDSL
jgi:hypothetical protein